MGVGDFPVEIAWEGREGHEEKLMWKNKSPTTMASVLPLWIPNVSFTVNKEMLLWTTLVTGSQNPTSAFFKFVLNNS